MHYKLFYYTTNICRKLWNKNFKKKIKVICNICKDKAVIITILISFQPFYHGNMFYHVHNVFVTHHDTL